VSPGMCPKLRDRSYDAHRDFSSQRLYVAQGDHPPYMAVRQISGLSVAPVLPGDFREYQFRGYEEVPRLETSADRRAVHSTGEELDPRNGVNDQCQADPPP